MSAGMCSIAVMLASVMHIFADTSHISFFFQAEDGIRDVAVTGVQTCALPISFARNVGGKRVFTIHEVEFAGYGLDLNQQHNDYDGLDVKGKAVVWLGPRGPRGRSEERRVGEECRSRWSPYH